MSENLERFDLQLNAAKICPDCEESFNSPYTHCPYCGICACYHAFGCKEISVDE